MTLLLLGFVALALGSSLCLRAGSGVVLELFDCFAALLPFLGDLLRPSACIAELCGSLLEVKHFKWSGAGDGWSEAGERAAAAERGVKL